MGLSLFLQVPGYAPEDQTPEPFRNTRDRVRRILAEPFETCPGFVVRRDWRRTFSVAK